MSLLACSRLGLSLRVEDRQVQSHLLSDKASLSKIRKLVGIDLAQAGADSDVVFECLVAVTEACSRALRARSDRRGKPARLTWKIERGMAEFCIEDYSALAGSAGEHPKRRIHEVVAAESGLEDLSTTVIGELMDDVEVDEDGRARKITMTKRLS
ncbi:MAG TPA: ATP-binding protein [Actinomycetota bacterium]|nr:ATP-binding protein [Actinomycetota bacterium]